MLWRSACTILSVLTLGMLIACGGNGSGGSGGGGGGGGGGNAGDFSVVLQPGTIAVGQGNSGTFSVSITSLSGFTGTVNISFGSFPSGVTASPSSFTVAAGTQQSVTISATASAPAAIANVTVTGTSGSLTHTANLSLGIDGLASSMHPPIRTRYLRTDAQWSYASLNFFPQQWILYDSATKRFFANNTALNRIDVFDAASELQIAQIAVPGPWVSDEAPDHSLIYVGTQVGDLYTVDPVAMQVVKRIPSVEIGPTGYPTYEVKVLADGRLALLGGQGGIPAVDGYANFGIWNPTDNSLAVYGSYYGGSGTGEPPVCDQMGNIAEFRLTADRTQVLVSSAFSDGTLCLVDPDTGTYRDVSFFGSFLPPMLVTPDGNSILLAGGASVFVLDARGIFLTDSFQIGDGIGPYRYVLSNDGNTLYAVGGDAGVAYNLKTHQQTGWFTTFTTGDLESSTTPQVVDETGLIAGVIGNGVSFLDGAKLLTSAPGLQVPNPSVSPTSGPPSGGTQTQVISTFNSGRLQQVYFGNAVAQAATVDNLGIHVQSPPGNPGPVDIVALANDGAIEVSPEWFSYGPTILEASLNSATAEGGGTATIYGYGFGPFGPGQQSPDLQVSIAGQPASIVQYISTLATAALDPYYPFPLEAVVITVPPGAAGSTVDVTVSNSAGTATAKNALAYWPAIRQFPLSNASLAQGIYDSHRDQYYFTDQSQVRVFSRTQGQWLTSFPIASSSRLWGIALSPNGKNLAVSDAGASLIYLLDPDTPGSVKTLTLPNTDFDSGELPGALAVTDSGIIYYASFYLYSTGNWAFHKLDSNTGAVTDYHWLQALAYGSDAYTRVLLSTDNTRVYVNEGGLPMAMDTASETTYFNAVLQSEGDYELTLSSNGTWMSSCEYMADTNLNPEALSAYTERDTWNVLAVFGEKLSPDGNLLFAPLQNGIDVLDGRRGNLLTRVSLPVSLSANFDALVSDGMDNVLVAITGDAGTGIAVIDLSSVPEPPPLSYLAVAHAKPAPSLPKFRLRNSTSTFSRADARAAELHSLHHGIPHVMKAPSLVFRQK